MTLCQYSKIKDLNLSNQKFDIVIVGAGTAGLEIAKNASLANLKICLIDQGSSEGKSLFNKIPLLSGKMLSNEKHCLNFISKRQQSLNNRQVPILQGIGFGGSGLINGGVSYLGLEKKFNEVFHFWPKDICSKVRKKIFNNSTFNYNREFGFSDALSDCFIEGLLKSNLEEKDDLDNSVDGVGLIHINTLHAKRNNFVNDFFKNARHKNIKKISNSKVLKIILENGVASGVVCKNLDSPNSNYTVYGTKIVISAGTIFSPQILINSGIGDPKTLKKIGVDVEINQKHVGKHLRDHANFRIDFECRGFDTINQKSKGLKLVKEIFKYYFMNNSILGGCGSSLAWNSSDFDGAKNINSLVRYHLVHFTQKREKLSSSGIKFENDQRASIGCFQVFPRSEGELMFDEREGLTVDPNYLGDHLDKRLAKEALSRAIKTIIEIGFKPHGDGGNAKHYLKHIEQNTFSGYHLIGTNRMAINKNLGVVDKQFKVFGAANIYVCDASIFPDFVSSHQYLPTLAVGKIFSSQQKWISL